MFLFVIFFCMSWLLDRLTKEQFQVVTQADGYSLIIASAGTGKTTTIVGRIAYLLEKKQVKPDNILLLTFTNKAASEMIGRLEDYYEETSESYDVDKIWSGTFHGVANALLRLMPEEVLKPYQSNFAIKLPGSLKTVFRHLADEFEWDKKVMDPGLLLDAYWLSLNLGYEKSEFGLYLQSQSQLSDGARGQAVDLLKHFEKAKEGFNGMDFADLLYVAREKMLTNKDVLKQIASQFQYVLVDEYQDTNYLQERFVEALSSVHGNIFAVGDYDQTIFSFQGSSVDIIGEFENKYPGAQVFNLKTNFRSTKQIIDLAKVVIEVNPRLYPKEIEVLRESSHLSEARPRYCHHFSDQSQVRMVMQNIVRNSMEAQGHHPHYVPLSQNAIIYRSNKTGNLFELACKEHGIAYIRKGGLSFFDRYEISEVLNVAEVVYNPRDRLAWIKLLSHVDGLGPVSAGRIVDALVGQHRQILRSFLEWGQGEQGRVLGQVIPAKGLESWKRLYGLLEELVDIKKPGPLLQAISEHDFFVQNILWQYLLKKSKKNIGQETLQRELEVRQEKVDMLINQASGYSSLGRFMSSVALVGQDYSKDKEGVSLMTIHSAKGLEWRKVFVVDVYDGAFPNTRLMAAGSNSPETMERALQEERRLLYVAITRAKDYLYINYPVKQVLRDGRQVLYPESRFMSQVMESSPGSLYLQKLM